MAQNALTNILHTRESACTYLGISLSTLNRLIENGTIKAIKLGRSVRFRQSDLDNPTLIIDKSIKQ